MDSSEELKDSCDSPIEDTVKKPKPSTYRPDIDGLRALAVTPVVIFHAYPEVFPGGFVGVDVFFVISGFLISGILFKELETNRFTYTSFYTRRVRRIFPTLLLVLSVTLVLGHLYLLAPKLQALAETMLAGTLFCANLQVLALEHSYFDNDITTNPLLHLWSLGVEEQFYFVWPFLAALLVKLPFRGAVVLQVAVLVVSFVINVAFLGYHDTNNMSFYMPLSRFWEMAAGGLLAYVAKYGSSTESYADLEPSANTTEAAPWKLRVQAMLAPLGLTLIATAFVTVNEHRSFPGAWAALPVTGAVCLIAAGPSALVNRLVLSCPATVYIGKISYCLYLWHWPLLVFARELYPNTSMRPTYMAPWVVLLVSTAIAIFTYECVEKLLRRRKAAWVTPCLVLCMVVVGSVAAAARASPREFSRLEMQIDLAIAPVDVVVAAPTYRAPILMAPTMESTTPRATTVTMVLQAQKDSDWNYGLADVCPQKSVYVTGVAMPEHFPFTDRTEKSSHETCLVLNGGNIATGLLLVLGDSHADMIKPRFVQASADARAAKKPFPTVVFQTRWGRAFLPCRPEFAGFLAMVKQARPQAVLLSSHWVKYINPGSTATSSTYPPQCCVYFGSACPEQSIGDVDVIFQQFTQALVELAELDIKVFVAAQSPQGWQQNPDTWINGGDVIVPASISRAAYAKKMAWLMDRIAVSVAKGNATLIDYADNYSRGDDVLMTDMAGEPIMSWQNHLRAYTSRQHLTVLDQVVLAAYAPS
ncbi:acyltransferase 3 [Achlya hypogyna]|uniref:Acyltransferase 3 n=1 Tax=Achlya hypogyna TaxID=1202772 RepID=A0A1V9ZJ24_ACHHY|nr:acyltransferase 3 [Achlya hypogyna]